MLKIEDLKALKARKVIVKKYSKDEYVDAVKKICCDLIYSYNFYVSRFIVKTVKKEFDSEKHWKDNNKIVVYYNDECNRLYTVCYGRKYIVMYLCVDDCNWKEAYSIHNPIRQKYLSKIELEENNDFLSIFNNVKN